MKNGNGNLVISTATIGAIIGVGIWAGSLQADMKRKVEASDFARIEQQVKNLDETLDEVKDELKELRGGNQEILDILRARD